MRRAVSLLKAFTAEQPRRGLAELARGLGLNKTTTFRLLQALESEGLVERTRGGEAYQLGPELLAHGGPGPGRARAARGGRAATCRRWRTRRARRRRSRCWWAGETLILDEATGGYMVGARPSQGTRWPAHAASTGKVLLAFLAPAPAGRRDARLLARAHAAHDRRAARCARALARVREQGYATAIEELEPGFVAVGAPVRDASGEVVAALSVGGPKARMGGDRLAACTRQVVAAARRVSARLGHGASGRPAN